jgi:hypothetical protein
MLYQAINANIVKNRPILNDTKEAHDQTFDWIAWHGIFAEGGIDRSMPDFVTSLPGRTK